MENRGNSSSSPSLIESLMSEYKDLLPVMAEKLDVENFMSELCGGFQILAEPERGLITPESLRKNSSLLVMEGMCKEESEAMVKEGDLDGDGALNEMEFCILMVRLSPGMMQDAEAWLEKALPPLGAETICLVSFLLKYCFNLLSTNF